MRILLPFVLACVVLAGCLPDHDRGQEHESYFEAQVTGDFQAVLGGSALFGYFTDPETQHEGAVLQLSAFGQPRGISFSGHSGGPFTSGDYLVIPFRPDPDDPQASQFDKLALGEFFGLYVHAGSGIVDELFFSDEGTITIEEATDNILRGTFSFDATGTLLGQPESEIHVLVEGAFHAVVGEITTN